MTTDEKRLLADHRITQFPSLKAVVSAMKKSASCNTCRQKAAVVESTLPSIISALCGRQSFRDIVNDLFHGNTPNIRGWR